MKHVFLIVLLISLVGCSPQKVIVENKCPKIYKNDFTQILNKKYKTIYEQDTVAFNEIRFECVYSPFYTHKVIYDKFGKWDKEIFPSNRKHPILMWENIDIFSNGKKYILMTNGIEECNHIYASVMLFDKKQRDLLTESYAEKDLITNLITDLIKNHNSDKKDFYEVYWKMVDPKHWERIKKSQNK